MNRRNTSNNNKNNNNNNNINNFAHNSSNASAAVMLRHPLGKATKATMLFTLSILVLLVTTSQAGAATVSQAALPSAMWNAKGPGGKPQHGVRAAIYPGSSMPHRLTLSMLWKHGANHTQDLQVQYRMASAEGNVPITSLFEEAATMAGCARILIPVDGVLTSVPVDDVTQRNFASFAGGLVTCDWAPYNSTRVNTEAQPRAVDLDVFAPEDFDAANYFDVIVCARNGSAMDVSAAPNSNYVLMLPFDDANNYSTIADVLAAGGAYNTSGFSVGEDVRFWDLVDTAAGLYTAVSIVPQSAGAAGHNPAAPIPLHATTAGDLSKVSTSTCFIRSVAPYVVERVDVGVGITGAFMGHATPVAECTRDAESAVHMMQRCDDDLFCLGFYTEVLDEVREVGRCYLVVRGLRASLNGSWANDDTGTTRLVHWKQTPQFNEHKCAVQAMEDMDLTVRLVGGNVEAAVVVDGIHGAYCVPSPYGCEAFSSCGTVRVAAGSTVEVLLTRVNTLDAHCTQTTLFSLFEGHPVHSIPNSKNVSLSTHTAAALVSAKIAGQLDYVLPDMFRRVVLTPSVTTFYTYLYRVRQVSVNVQQASFGAVGGALSGPALTFTPTPSVNLARTCGGSAGFLGNFSGASDRCDVWAPCPQRVVDVASSSLGSEDFSGYLRVDIDWSVVGAGYEGHWVCNGANDEPRVLTLALHFSAETSTPTSQHGWPGLSKDGDRTVYPLVLWDIAAPNVGPAPSLLTSIRRNLSLGTVAEGVIEFKHLEMFEPAEAYVYHGSETLACVVDTIDRPTVSCVFPIAAAARFVTVSMEDGNLARNAVAWSIEAADGTLYRSGSCGGSSGFADGDAVDGNCGVFRTCVTTLLDGLPTSETEPYAMSLVLRIPHTVADFVPCEPFAFRAMANFTTVAPSVEACGAFTCPSTGACVPLSAVCDGSLNCADGSDERGCFDWYDVELDATLSRDVIFNTSSVGAEFTPSDFSIVSEKHCRILAMRNGSQAFAFSAARRECVAYNFTAPTAATVPYDHTAFRVNTSGYVVYSVLASRLQYDVCSSRLSCSKHGAAARLTTGLCGCGCHGVYTGSACNLVQALAPDYSQIFLLFPAKLNTSEEASINGRVVVRVLKKWQSLGRYTCEYPLRVDADRLSITCTDSNQVLTEGIVNNVTTLATLNRLFSADETLRVNASLVSATSIPRFESLAICSLQNGKRVFACTLPGPTSIGGLAVSATAASASGAGAALYANVTFQVAASARRLGVPSTRTVAIRCPADALSLTLSSATRTTQTCFVDVEGANAAGDLVLAYSVFLVDAGTGTTVPLAATGAGTAKALFRRQLHVPSLVTPVDPVIVVEDFSMWQWAAVSLLSLGFCLLCAVVTLAVIHRAHLRRVLKSTEADSTLTALQKVVTSLFLRVTMVEIDDPTSPDDVAGGSIRDADGVLVHELVQFSKSVAPLSKKVSAAKLIVSLMKVVLKSRVADCSDLRMNRKQYTFLCGSFWLSTWVVGVFMVLLFVSSSGVSSNTWLVVEQYADRGCQASTLSAIPQASLYITDETATVCVRRHIAGKLSGSYFSGYCVQNTTGTNLIAKIRFGHSKAVCDASPYLDVPADTCAVIPEVWGPSTSGIVTYTRVSCASIETTVARFGYLETMSSLSDPTDATVVQQTPASRIAAGPLDPNRGGYLITQERRTGTFVSYARMVGTYETTAVGGTLIPVSGQQLVVQHGAELFKDPAEPYFSPITASIEQQEQPFMASLVNDASRIAEDVEALLPPFALPELPVGQLYGNFNQTHALTGAEAAPGATRYYGARRTHLDIGAFIDPAVMKEGQGFTISFNLRATPDTFGFAFAVVDAFENLQNGRSPILDLMIDMMKRNAAQDHWFNDDYHIYHSVFVDGPSRQLHFIYASPGKVLGNAATSSTNKTLGKTVGVLSWNLEDIKMERLLNGLWHQVRLVLRLEANLMKVQLIVDGETSRSGFGWNQCLRDDLRAIADMATGINVAVYEHADQVADLAMLWTGYFNGGLGDLQYLPYVEGIFDVWKASSRAIQAHNRINVTGFTTLGYVMCALSVALFMTMVVTSGRALYREGTRTERRLVQGMFLRYMSIMSGLPVRRGCEPFTVLKYTTAKRWLGVNDTQLGQFIDELQNSTSKVSEELHRVLYLAGKSHLTRKEKDSNGPMPTMEQWEKLIQDDELIYVWQNNRRFPFFKEGRPEQDPYKVPLDMLRRDSGNWSFSGIFGKSPNSERRSSGACSPTSSPYYLRSPKHAGNINNSSNNYSVQYSRNEGEEAAATENFITAVQRASTTLNDNGDFGDQSSSNRQTSALTAKSDAIPNVGIDIRQLLLPVISVMQSLYVWMTSSQFVTEYLAWFEGAFSFVSIDFFVSFNVPTIVPPLVQLGCGLLIFLLLLYLTAMDELRFSWYVARYVLKRDELETLDDEKAKASSYNERIRRFQDPYGKVKQFPKEYEVEVLPVREAMRIDRFVGLSAGANAHEQSPTGSNTDTITVKDAGDRTFVLHRDDWSKRYSGLKQATLLRVKSDFTATLDLSVVGICCREHKQRRLAPQLQTDIWPFVYAPQCCVVVNGVRCNASQGIIYSCQKREKTTDGSTCLCDYAVCERHYRGSLLDGIKADVLGLLRTGEQRGFQWILATAIVLGANAAYMPFVKTAMMILACHPLYQCEFTECHDFADQKYLIAFYFSLCLITLFGVGLPLLQVVQLHRRHGILFHVFFADEYKGRYEERDSQKHDQKAFHERVKRSSKELHEVPSSLRAKGRSNSSFLFSQVVASRQHRPSKDPAVDSSLNSSAVFEAARDDMMGHRMSVEDSMRRLRDDGTSVVDVTHDDEVPRSIADSAIHAMDLPPPIMQPQTSDVERIRKSMLRSPDSTASNAISLNLLQVNSPNRDINRRRSSPSFLLENASVDEEQLAAPHNVATNDGGDVLRTSTIMVSPPDDGRSKPGASQASTPGTDAGAGSAGQRCHSNSPSRDKNAESQDSSPLGFPTRGSPIVGALPPCAASPVAKAPIDADAAAAPRSSAQGLAVETIVLSPPNAVQPQSTQATPRCSPVLQAAPPVHAIDTNEQQQTLLQPHPSDLSSKGGAMQYLCPAALQVDNNSMSKSPLFSPSNTREAMKRGLSTISLFSEGHSDDEKEDDDENDKDEDTAKSASHAVVRLSEWCRFLVSDPTVLGNLYKPLEFEWIYLSPILLLWKVIIICPAVFLPFETLEQLLGICVAEVGFAVFIFVTAPFTSSIAALMYKAGCFHQVLFLGLRALDIVQRFQGHQGYGYGFVILTMSYLTFSAGCMGWTIVGSQIRRTYDKHRSTAALKGLGYQYAPTTSLYVVPAVDAVRSFDREQPSDEPSNESDASHNDDDVVALQPPSS